MARDLKLGRVVRSEGGLASSLGFAAQYDAVQRMTGASTGRGSTEGGSQGVVLGRWSYAYGQADELVSITEATGGVWQYASGAEGRITSRSGPDGSDAFAYDGEGRRSEDASSRYTYDWRGRLVQVDIKTGGHAGERIVYAYDATGRLLSRTNLGQIPPGGSDSDRPFIAKRAFVWDGQRLAAEAGLNFQDQPLWRQQYVPGQRGLDDAPLVRVERDLQATPSTETYAILRDEMGTPLAVVDEAQGPGLGGRLRLLVRYLSAPYGQRHSELGPELVAIAFDATITQVASTDQRPTAKQTVAGALRIVTTSPLALASLTSGLVLEQWDQAAGSWRTAPRSDFAIGTADDDPTDLRVMRLAGWPKATRYRITLLPSITDTFGRGLILPEGERQGVVLELAVPEDGTTPPSYARVFPLAYDKGASDTFAGAFPGGQTFGFQGAWTDPATGLAYHRARWYDAANATWLSEDPKGDVNGPNISAPFGWMPYIVTDPLGLDWAEYTGKEIVWYGGKPEDRSQVLDRFPATSGLRDRDTGYPDYQKVAFTGLKGLGPIPPGTYRIALRPSPKREAAVNSDTGQLYWNKKGGIQMIRPRVTVPGGRTFTYEGWGTIRAYLEPDRKNNMLGRFPADRFYVHNSNKGFTHGCIETSTGFFNSLLRYRTLNPKEKYSIFKVRYTGESTRGATEGAVYPQLDLQYIYVQQVTVTGRPEQ